MKFVFALVLLFLPFKDPIKISKINRAKEEAKKAYESGDFKKAVQTYRYLVDSLDVKEDEVMLNLANAYYQQKDTTNSTNLYQSLASSTKGQISSRANQQLGIMANEKGKAEEALSLFKQAIKADPTNEQARYNYELLKKKMDEKKKRDEQKNKDQNKDQQNKDQQNKDQQNKDQQKKDEQKKDQQNKDQQKKDQESKDEQQKKEQEQKDQQKKDQQNKDQKEQEKKDAEEQQKDQQQDEKNKQEQEKKAMKNFNPDKMPKMSEEKAHMILEAMRNQEKQYLQQQRRKATKPREKGKPDW
jgi:Ca-activated chloride channel family protein